MSYFTDFRDNLKRQIGVDTGANTARTLGDAFKAGREALNGKVNQNGVETKPDADNSVKLKDVDIPGGFQLPALSPVVIIAGLAALYFLTKKSRRA